MAVVDLESKHAPGWTVDPGANRNLSRRPYLRVERIGKRISSFGGGLRRKITKHDLDKTYTSYRWLEAILLDDEMRVSYSENEATGDPWNESLWERRKTGISSPITEPHPAGPASCLQFISNT